MGAAAAALLAGALLVVACIAVVCQVCVFSGHTHHHPPLRAAAVAFPPPSTLLPFRTCEVTPTHETSTPPLAVASANTTTDTKTNILPLEPQAPARQRHFELESQQQAILAGAERAGFKAGEREEAKRQLMLGADLQKQMLSDKDWTAGKSPVQTSGKAGDSGLQEMLNTWGWTSPAAVQVRTSPIVQVQTSPMIQQVVHTSPMTVQVHTPAIWTGASPFVQVPQSTIVQAPTPPIVHVPQPQVVQTSNVGTFGVASSARPAAPATHVAPSPPISPQVPRPPLQQPTFTSASPFPTPLLHPLFPSVSFLLVHCFCDSFPFSMSQSQALNPRP